MNPKIHKEKLLTLIMKIFKKNYTDDFQTDAKSIKKQKLGKIAPNQLPKRRLHRQNFQEH